MTTVVLGCLLFVSSVRVSFTYIPQDCFTSTVAWDYLVAVAVKWLLRIQTNNSTTSIKN